MISSSMVRAKQPSNYGFDGNRSKLVLTSKPTLVRWDADENSDESEDGKNKNRFFNISSNSNSRLCFFFMSIAFFTICYFIILKHCLFDNVS